MTVEEVTSLLKAHHGNVKRISRATGINSNKLYKFIYKHKINVCLYKVEPDYRQEPVYYRFLD
jgi:DNA-binding NtrC family response regulator